MSDDITNTGGNWRGYYLYEPGGRRHAMSLELAFTAGTVRGSGDDDIGSFVIRGSFEPEGVRVWWTKRYLGAHGVDYAGVRDGECGRVVYGSWSIAGQGSGGFRIWRGAVPVDAAIEVEAEAHVFEADDAVLVPVRSR